MNFAHHAEGKFPSVIVLGSLPQSLRAGYVVNFWLALCDSLFARGEEGSTDLCLDRRLGLASLPVLALLELRNGNHSHLLAC